VRVPNHWTGAADAGVVSGGFVTMYEIIRDGSTAADCSWCGRLELHAAPCQWWADVFIARRHIA
jgi:hypothetical protein